MARLRIPMPSAEQIAARARKRKERKTSGRSEGQSSRVPEERGTRVPEADPGAGLEIVPQPSGEAPSGSSPPEKRARTAEPPSQANVDRPRRGLVGLGDTDSPRADRGLACVLGKQLLTSHDFGVLKEKGPADVVVEAVHSAITIVQGLTFTAEALSRLSREKQRKADLAAEMERRAKEAEATNEESLQAAAEAADRAVKAEESWSASNHKLVAAEAELEALRLDLAKVAAERDELRGRADCWPSKKKVVYRKGAEAGYLKGRNDILKELKLGTTEFPDPEPSEDEDDAAGEISSDDDDEEAGSPVDLTSSAHPPPADPSSSTARQSQAE